MVRNYLTAYQMLHYVYRQLAPGRRILVHSAAGGVGTALLQLGRQRVLAPDSVDLVLDAIGGPSLYQSYRLLRPGGMLISYGVTKTASNARRMLDLLPGILPTFLLGLLPRRKVARYIIFSVMQRRPDWYRADLAHVLELLRNDTIRLPRLIGCWRVQQLAASLG